MARVIVVFASPPHSRMCEHRRRLTPRSFRFGWRWLTAIPLPADIEPVVKRRGGASVVTPRQGLAKRIPSSRDGRQTSIPAGTAISRRGAHTATAAAIRRDSIAAVRSLVTRKRCDDADRFASRFASQEIDRSGWPGTWWFQSVAPGESQVGIGLRRSVRPRADERAWSASKGQSAVRASR